MDRPLRIAAIGDIHDHQPRLEMVLDALRAGPPLDLVLLVGDIARNPPWSRRSLPVELHRMRGDIARIVAQVGELGAPVRFVPGNHDPKEVPHPANLDRRVEAVAGLRVGGIGGAGPERFDLPYEWDEDEIASLRMPPCDLLLVHAPPRETPLDRLAGDGRPLGSAAIRARALAHHGLLVCGHIHEGAGAVLLDDCLCVNAGALGEPHGRARVVRIEAEATAGGWRWRVELHDLEGGGVQTWSHQSGPAAGG